MYGYAEQSEFNRFENLDGLEWKLINHLVYSESKYSQLLWKILAYPTMDCLFKPNLTTAERLALIDVDDGGETTKRVFMSPFLDDAWTQQCAHLHIYIDGIYPVNHGIATVNMGIETISHSKIIKISGDATAHEIDSSNPLPNPNDSSSEGEQIVLYKNRESVMLKCILAEFNGLYVDGVGYLQFNQRTNYYNQSQYSLFNGRSYIGHLTKMAVLISGVSDSGNVGF